MLVSVLVAVVVAQLFYINRLHKRLRGYEHVWEQIEEVADHNQDGTFTINIQHMEEAHPIIEAHTNVDDADDLSGVIEVPFNGTGGLGPNTPRGFGPPRAA